MYCQTSEINMPL